MFGIQATNFEISDDKGSVVANVVCDKTTRTSKITYTKCVGSYLNVSGKLFLYARVDHVKFQNEKDIPLVFKIENKVYIDGTIHFNIHHMFLENLVDRYRVY